MAEKSEKACATGIRKQVLSGNKHVFYDVIKRWRHKIFEVEIITKGGGVTNNI